MFQSQQHGASVLPCLSLDHEVRELSLAELYNGASRCDQLFTIKITYEPWSESAAMGSYEKAILRVSSHQFYDQTTEGESCHG